LEENFTYLWWEKKAISNQYKLNKHKCMYIPNNNQYISRNSGSISKKRKLSQTKLMELRGVTELSWAKISRNEGPKNKQILSEVANIESQMNDAL
jgi:hypothetical protein